MSSAISVLTNTPETLNIRKRDIFQFNFPQSDEEI